MPIGEWRTRMAAVKRNDDKAYLRDVAKTAVLTPEDELETATAARAGDATARERLILANLRLVLTLAGKFAGYGVDYEDLVQDGNVGLVRAADRFRPELGHRFSTFAVNWILREIRAGLSDNARTIRLPRHRVERLRTVPEDEYDERDRAARLSERVISLDVVPDEILECALWRKTPEDPATTAERQDEAKKVCNRLGRMAPRDAYILRERAGRCRTLKDIGAEINLSRERVRQICNQAKERYLQAM